MRSSIEVEDLLEIIKELSSLVESQREIINKKSNFKEVSLQTDNICSDIPSLSFCQNCLFYQKQVSHFEDLLFNFKLNNKKLKEVALAQHIFIENLQRDNDVMRKRLFRKKQSAYDRSNSKVYSSDQSPISKSTEIKSSSMNNRSELNKEHSSNDIFLSHDIDSDSQSSETTNNITIFNQELTEKENKNVELFSIHSTDEKDNVGKDLNYLCEPSMQNSIMELDSKKMIKFNTEESDEFTTNLDEGSDENHSRSDWEDITEVSTEDACEENSFDLIQQYYDHDELVESVAEVYSCYLLETEDNLSL